MTSVASTSCTNGRFKIKQVPLNVGVVYQQQKSKYAHCPCCDRVSFDNPVDLEKKIIIFNEVGLDMQRKKITGTWTLSKSKQLTSAG